MFSKDLREFAERIIFAAEHVLFSHSFALVPLELMD